MVSISRVYLLSPQAVFSIGVVIHEAAMIL
jgi:hypothetical protein